MILFNKTTLWLFVISCCLFISVQISYAFTGRFGTSVGGSVGNSTITISGSVAPYASIVLTSHNVFLRSTVADAHGTFTFSQVLTSTTFDSFCLDAIDIKRIGESYTCFSVDPHKDMFIVFLPPTLGLQRDEITVGDTLVASGYSIPDATVTLHVSNGDVYTMIASDTGYYSFSIPMKSQGTYQVYADAHMGDNTSSVPVRKDSFTVVSQTTEKIQHLKQLAFSFPRAINNKFPLGILWIAVAIIILIIILLARILYYWIVSHKKRMKKLEID